MRDLSRRHEFVSSLFSMPDSAAAWQQLQLKENLSSGPRRATVINLCLDGTRSDSDAPLLSGIPVIAKGQPLSGPFFPLLAAARQGRA